MPRCVGTPNTRTDTGSLTSNGELVIWLRGRWGAGFACESGASKKRGEVVRRCAHVRGAGGPNGRECCSPAKNGRLDTSKTSKPAHIYRDLHLCACGKLRLQCCVHHTAHTALDNEFQLCVHLVDAPAGSGWRDYGHAILRRYPHDIERGDAACQVALLIGAGLVNFHASRRRNGLYKCARNQFRASEWTGTRYCINKGLQLRYLVYAVALAN